MGNRHWRALGVALFTFGSAVIAADPASAGAHDKSVDVSVDFYDPGIVRASNPMLNCDPESKGLCSFRFDGVAEMMGTWTGSTTYQAVATADSPDGITGDFQFEVWETFTGTVAGCGEGTFEWYLMGNAAFSRVDPVTRTVPFTARLWLIAGSGTGDLEGITGSAAGEGEFNALFEQTGHLTGEVTCAAVDGGRGRSNRHQPRTILARTG